jgi:hypothetical protein
MFSLKSKMAFGSLVASAASSALAFQPATTPFRAAKTSLNVGAVDPATVSKKDYDDILGTAFDGRSMEDQLKSTKLLYPKHVDVIEDIAPVADRMVDEVVRYITLHARFELGVCSILVLTFPIPHLVPITTAFGNRRCRLATAGLSSRSFEGRMGR